MPSTTVQQKTSLFKRRRLLTDHGQDEENENDRLQQALKNETQSYFAAIDKGEFEANIESVDFWNSHAGQFPTLPLITLRYQALPATSASVERLFSIAGRGCTGNRNAIKPTLLKSETLCKFNRKFLPPDQLSLYH